MLRDALPPVGEDDALADDEEAGSDESDGKEGAEGEDSDERAAGTAARCTADGEGSADGTEGGGFQSNVCLVTADYPMQACCFALGSLVLPMQHAAVA